MGLDLKVGAIVLSTDCSCVALVRRHASKLWGFPRMHSKDADPRQAAKDAVLAETGITLTQPLREVTFEAEEEGLNVLLYLVTGIEIRELATQRRGAPDSVSAAWFPLRQVFDSDPEGSGASVAPFLPALHRWLDSNLEVFGSDLAAWDEETGESLAGCMLYRRRSWRGSLPVIHLSRWAQDHQLPSPCYDSVQNPRVLNMQCVTCILPHLGLQITPDWGSVTTEDATQNAALAAIMFLAGGLGKGSPHCIISLVGSDPTVRPLQLDEAQAQAMLDKRVQLLEQQQLEAERVFEQQQRMRAKAVSDLKQQKAGLAAGGREAEGVVQRLATWQASLPQAEQALVHGPKCIMNFPAAKGRSASQANGGAETRAVKKAKGKAAPVADLQRNQMKNPIQELKETIDRYKWQQPEYTFYGQPDDGGHMCQVSVTDAGIHDIQSQPCQSQRAAKASAAMQALSQLVVRGLA